MEFRKYLRSIKRRVKLKFGELRLKRAAAKTNKLKMVVGAGGICQPGWIPTELDFLDLLKPSQWSSFFNENSIKAILAEHVWEHLSEKDGLVAARTCHTYLSKGGYLRVAVPDGFHPNKSYIDAVKPGGHGAGSDDHKVLYNVHTLSQLFEQAGFNVRTLEYFDDLGSFHFSHWDPMEGKIHRSKRYDERNSDENLNYTSLILDCYKI